MQREWGSLCLVYVFPILSTSLLILFPFDNLCNLAIGAVGLMDRGKKIFLDGPEAQVLNVGVLRVDPKLGKDVWLVGKLLCRSTFSARIFKNVFQDLWKSRNGVEVREVEANLFTFRFASKADRDAVLTSDPWSFNRFTVALEILDINVHPTQVPITRVPFWVQVHNLPYSLWSDTVARVFGNSFAGLITIDRRGNRKLGSFFRLKVWVDATLPLRRGQVLAAEGGQNVHVFFLYEKLHSYCVNCGLLDHVEKHCDQARKGEGEDSPYAGLKVDVHDNDQDAYGPSGCGEKESNSQRSDPRADANSDAYGDSNYYEEDFEEVAKDANEEVDRDLDGPKGPVSSKVGGDGAQETSKAPLSHEVAFHAKNQSKIRPKGPRKDDAAGKKSMGPVKDNRLPMKRSGVSSSALDLRNTGVSPPLKKLNSDDGLGSAAAVVQPRPPQ